MPDLRLDTFGVPIDVIRGRVPRYRSVHYVYKKVYVQTFMELLHKSFWAKVQEGSSDEFGFVWQPLKRRTKETKRKLFLQEMAQMGSVQQPLLSGNLTNKRQLSPNQLEHYRGVYRNFLEEGVSRRTADRRAMRQTPASINFGLWNIPINVRTGKLAEAFSPPVIANNRIYNGPSQRFTQSDDGLFFKFEIVDLDYVEEVDEARPLWRNVEDMMLIALQEALNAARNEFTLLQNSENKLGTHDSRPSSKLD